MRVMYMGTPEIAVSCLNAVASKQEVVCVVTQTDKPKGRGHNLCGTPVKKRAQELGIDVVQPTTFKDHAFLPILEQYRPDVIVVVAYGRILPKYVLDYPKYGCINVHASLLPKYRGASPIQWCIVCGETESGVTTMKMDVGLDTGDMLLKTVVPITDTMTAGELHDIYCTVGSELIVKTLDELTTIIPQKQDDSKASYAPLITKEMCRIDFNKTPKELCNFIRGLNPFPCAFAKINGKVLKIYFATPYDKTGRPGEIIEVGTDYIAVACNGGSIKLTDVQLEGKKRMDVKTFLLGNQIKVGTVL